MYEADKDHQDEDVKEDMDGEQKDSEDAVDNEQGEDTQNKEFDRSQYEAEEKEPGEFDSAQFLTEIDSLNGKLQSEKYQDPEGQLSYEEMKSFVDYVNKTLGNFKTYTLHSQENLEKVRNTMKDMRDKLHKTIQARSHNPQAGRKVFLMYSKLIVLISLVIGNALFNTY